MRHTEPTSCGREEQGNQQLQKPQHSGMFSQVFNPKQTRLSLHHTRESTSLQVCSSLRRNLGGSSGPHVASRTRQGEKKSLAKWWRSKKPSVGWQQRQSTAAASWKNKPQAQQNQGILMEKLLLAQQRGTGHGAGMLLQPLGSQEITERDIQSLNTEINPKRAT